MGKIWESFLKLFPPVIRSTGELPREYRKAVTKLADGKVDQRFLGDSGEHAKFVAGLILEHSTEASEVLIYSKALEDAFYEEVLRSSKCHIKVVLDNEEGIQVIKRLPQDVQNRLVFRFAHTPKGAHFLLLNNAVRFELKGDELFAICNFNESDETIKKLSNRFEELWKNADLYPKPLLY